jgi:hypothetical protein
MNKIVLIAAFAASFGVECAPSSAATLTAKVLGVFDTLTDEIGVFGPPGGSYVNQPFALVGDFDTSTFFHGGGSGGNAFGDDLSGDFLIVTINGVSRRFNNSGIGVFHTTGTHEFSVGADEGSNHFHVDIQHNFGPGSPIPLSILDPASISCPAPSLVCFGGMTMESAGLSTHGNLTPSQVTTAITPIPAALPLLLFALAGLSLAGWRYQHAAAA